MSLRLSEKVGIHDLHAHSSVGYINTATRHKNRLAPNNLQRVKCSAVRDINSVLADSQQQGRFARWALFNATQNQHEPAENVKPIPNCTGFARHESDHVLKQGRMML